MSGTIDITTVCYLFLSGALFFSYSGRLLIYLYIYNLVKLYILVIAAISFRYYDISVPVTKEKTMIQLIRKYTTLWLNIKK